MNYNSRSYPYPVLGVDNNFRDDQNKDTFKPDLTISSDYRIHKLEVTFPLKNDELLKLIRNEKVAFCLQLYCRSTMFRQSFSTNKQKEILEIKSYLLRDVVEVDFFICASENITNYKNSEFNAIFNGTSFDIEKGDIIAFGGTTSFIAHKSPEELKSVSSFMSIDTENKSDVPMYNDYNFDKIKIILSEEDYENYQLIKKLSPFISTLHSSIVLPALVEAIRFISTDQGKDYSDKKWFTLLGNLSEKFPASDYLQSAQKILDLPVNRSFNALIENSQ